MPYPFDNNSLNGYLLSIRKLRSSEFTLYKRLSDFDGARDGKKEILNKINSVQDEIKRLRQHRLPPREFDIFLTSNEKLEAEYEGQCPRPLQAPNCSHTKTELRIRTIKDKTKHLWEQCLTCGKGVSAKKKSDYKNWGSFPLFDHNLEENLDKNYRSWCNGLKEYLRGKGDSLTDDIHIFDSVGLERFFKTLHPRPVSPDSCSHDEKRLTRRHYNDGGSAVVEQCVTCGKHCKSLSKRSVACFESLPLFDEELEPGLLEKTSQWLAKYHEYLENERELFYTKIADQIASGELKITDDSKFGTYYDSEEWLKTRIRILKRDDHECQSCGANADCVHHITYERLGRENDIDLISLCNDCHDIIHRFQDNFQYSYRMVPDEIRVNVKHILQFITFR